MSTHYQGTPTEIQALDTFIKLQRSLHTIAARIVRHRTGGGLSGSQFGTLEMLFSPRPPNSDGDRQEATHQQE